MKEFTDADRPALLDLLKVHGPLNVPEIARLRGTTPTAARQQLAVLLREDLVQTRTERRKVGRPTLLYSLTEKADALFPQAYAPLALHVLRQLRYIDGEKKVDEIFARRTREQLQNYRPRFSGKSLAYKFHELAKIRSEEGYMARSEGRGLTEHHCPIAAIAKEFPQACAYEKRLFESALGMKIDRTDHLASGGRACTYRPAASSS